MSETAPGRRFRGELAGAWRSLRRSPSYAAAVLVILALGIGANAAIYTIVHRVLLAPLPFPDADRVVRIFETYSRGKGRGTVSMPNFVDWRRESTAFETLALYHRASRNLQDRDAPERLGVLESNAALFEALGARPLLGRLFSAADESPEAPPVVVLSEGFWRRRFGGDRSAVGSRLTLDGVACDVVGVLPNELQFPNWNPTPELYLLHRPTAETAAQRGSHYLDVLGKLRAGATIDDARKQLEQVSLRLESAYPDAQTGRSVQLVPLADSIRGEVKPTLRLLTAAVALVLLIACANLAGLALARGAQRRREISIRAALGASRRDLTVQMLVESSLLGIGGALAGTLVASAVIQLLKPAVAAVLPALGPMRVDLGTFALLLIAGAATGVAFGLLPALVSSGDDPGRDLLEATTRSTGGRGRQRARRLLVAAQIALSLVLLIASGLLLRSFLRLVATPAGFDRVGVLTVHLTPPQTTYEADTLAPRLLTPILRRLEATPGVEHAGLVSLLPVQSWGSNSSYTIDGLEPPAEGDDWWVEVRVVSPDVFAALGVPLVAGRPLSDSDAAVPGAADSVPYPVVVNQAFVRRHFPSGDAVGRLVRFDEQTVATIVGVVGDVRQAGLDREPLPELSFVYNDPRVAGSLFYDVVLVVRATLPPASLTGAVREAVRQVDPTQPLHTVRTLEEVLDRSLASRRLTLGLVAGFGALALLLAGTGLYALISYLVAQRTREVGVRMALGATASSIERTVLGEGAGLAAAGIVVGGVAAWSASSWLRSQLVGVEPLDPLTWGLVVAFLLAVSLTASLAPARRAARTDPAQVLRPE